MDGTDYLIVEPIPFSNTWSSHKFHKPALQYEVALSLDAARIIYISTRWPTGSHSDLKILERSLFHKLGSAEFYWLILDTVVRNVFLCLCLVIPCRKNLLYCVLDTRPRMVDSKKFRVLCTSFRKRHDLDEVFFLAVVNIVSNRL